MQVADELEAAQAIADELGTIIAEQTRRVRTLEAALRELLDAFNPSPRVSTRLTLWGRAAMALDNTPDQDDKANSN